MDDGARDERVWALPFGFLVMVAVWNRYDRRVEEAARDLGATRFTTFREVTLPLIWTGIFGAFLFGFTLSWNEYDRTALALGSGKTTLAAPDLLADRRLGHPARPLRARHGDDDLHSRSLWRSC